MKIIAVDPGASGAFCIKNGLEILVYDMPSMKGKKDKKQMDIASIVKLLSPHKDAKVFVIEDVHCMVGNGSSACFHLGGVKEYLKV